MSNKGSCWSGYHRVGGTKQFSKGSCAKNKFNMNRRTKRRGSKRRTKRRGSKRRTKRRGSKRITRRRGSKRRTKRRGSKRTCRPTGNKRSAKMVNGKCVKFGYKPMSIKSNNPARKRSFCARHGCSKKKDKATAGYQSCKAWRCKTG